jgi:7,8-dihydropterin-6-yl-methyl-4-(beta-D-ribofuranosyl)aminobenzene 5'-phosphate synthase
MTTEIRLNPVDRVEVLSLVDNVTDLLLPTTDVAKRLGPDGPQGQRSPDVAAPLVESGRALDTPVAEHGLSLLVSVTRGDRCGTALLDTGCSVDGLLHNLHVLGVDPGQIEAIVLSHGHFDHTIGLNGLASRVQPLPPLVVHPDVWLRRRIAIPGRQPFELPTTSKERVRDAGFPMIEERGASCLLDDCLLVTGEIERTTEFEQGLPVHQAFRDGEWQADPLLPDDQALVVHVRDKGLVVITGCGHAGVINTVRYARKLTGVDQVFGVIGGFHLGTAPFEPVVQESVKALGEFGPQVIAPMHCTGWRATHALAAALPNAFVPGSVGTRYVFQGEEG